MEAKIEEKKNKNGQSKMDLLLLLSLLFVDLFHI